MVSANSYVGNDRPTIESPVYKPLEVVVQNANKNVSEDVYRDSFMRASRAFRAIVQKEKVLSFYKLSKTYEKPSERKRRKKNEAMRKRMEALYPRKMRDREEEQKQDKKEVMSDYDLF